MRLFSETIILTTNDDEDKIYSFADALFFLSENDFEYTIENCEYWDEKSIKIKFKSPNNAKRMFDYINERIIEQHLLKEKYRNK